MENAGFWTTLDKLINESGIVIDRPKGTKQGNKCDAPPVRFLLINERINTRPPFA